VEGDKSDAEEERVVEIPLDKEDEVESEGLVTPDVGDVVSSSESVTDVEKLTREAEKHYDDVAQG
jgi:hypothetical protein